MLYAKNEQGIYINARNAKRSSTYFCPSCLQSVIVKRGTLKAAHFAHKKRGCVAFSEGETTEHLSGKELLASWCQQFHCQVELEAYQENLKQRPDVLCHFENYQLALEFQCAPLSLNEMVQRSYGYQNHGFKYLWILGRRHYPQYKLTQQTAQFIRWHKNLGFYLIFLDTAYQRFEVLYGIQMADLLPVKYLRFFAVDMVELAHFLHTDHHIDYFTLTDLEKRRQRTNIVKKMHNYDRQIYQIQNLCYENHLSFIEVVESVLTSTYFPPIYRQAAFIWKVKCYLALLKTKQTLTPLQVLNHHNLFALPFVCLDRITRREWDSFQKQMAKIDFTTDYRYNKLQ